MTGPALTPLRVAWLAHLAKHGETPWSKMPRKDKAANRFTRHKPVAPNGTWQPMIAAGWITSRFAQRSFREPVESLFAITDEGRAVLSRAQGDTP